MVQFPLFFNISTMRLKNPFNSPASFNGLIFILLIFQFIIIYRSGAANNFIADIDQVRRPLQLFQ